MDRLLRHAKTHKAHKILVEGLYKLESDNKGIFQYLILVVCMPLYFENGHVALQITDRGDKRLDHSWSAPIGYEKPYSHA